MYDFLLKNGQKLSFGVGAAIVLIFVATMVMGVSGLGGSPTKEELYPTSIFDFGLYGSYFLVIIAAILAMAFPLYYVATNPKSAVMGLISAAVIVVIFFIGYAMSSDEVTAAMKEFNVTSGTGKFIGGAIYTAMFMAGGAVLIMIISEIRGSLK